MQRSVDRKHDRLRKLAVFTMAASSPFLMTACSSSPSGTVNGRMVFMGGPAGGALPLSTYDHSQASVPPMPGKVTFTGTAGMFVAATDKSGRFSAHLPVGTYLAIGRSRFFQDGKLECRGVEVRGVSMLPRVVVKAGTNTVVAVTCNGR